MDVARRGSHPPQDAEPIYLGLKLLLKALEFSRDLAGDGWAYGEADHLQFAVELNRLLRLGLSECGVRWLLGRGYVEHRLELTAPCDGRRTFEVGGWSFQPNSCFILTEGGRAALLSWRCGTEQPPPAEALVTVFGPPDITLPSVPAGRPRWDKDERRLLYADKVVKEFRVPAPNQETILSCFEEEGWPRRIDDPLPPEPGVDPKRRLHDTLTSLNRCQRNLLLQFLGDGSGLGVRWAPR